MGWFSKKKNKEQEDIDINSILELTDQTEAEMKIDDYLNRKSSFGDNMEKLTTPEKNFLFVENLLREVNNGGFNQWFFNSSGDHAHETLIALKNIGAIKMADIVEKAISFWPGAKVPKDELARRDILEEISDTADPEWNKLDNMFYSGKDDLDDYQELLLGYVRKNKENFET